MRSGPLCALLWRILTWCSDKSPGQTHSRETECHSGQTVSPGPDHPDGVVPPPSGLSGDLCPVAHPSSGPVCDQVQPQTSKVCLSCSRSRSLGCRCLKSILGRPGSICLSPNSHSGKGSGTVVSSTLPENDSHSPRVAQHALVLGSSTNVQPDPPVPAQPAQPPGPAVQPDPSQEPGQPEPSRLAPRATAIKKQGFSKAVADRIEAPQRGSTRSVYG